MGQGNKASCTVSPCGGLNMLGPWEVALLGGVALLKEVCHCGDGALKLPSVEESVLY